MHDADSSDMDSYIREIPARSKKQVMDWSLVLASQGIEAAIHHAADGWRLVVSVEDYERALEHLRLYKMENRRWQWQRTFPGAGLSFHAASVLWSLMMAAFYYIDTQMNAIRPAGMMDSAKVLAGEWWRLFTAVTLHADAGHLVANATTGFLFLGVAMAHYGPGTALLAAFLAGAGGNVTGLLIYPEPHRGLGASGMVMGALGLLTVQSLAWLKSHPRPRQLLLRALGAGVLILVLFGFSPGTDIIAHVGGFVFGAIFGVLLHLLPRRWADQTRSDQFALVLLAGLVMYTWYRALG
jgi:rhomboid protease GluP